VFRVLRLSTLHSIPPEAREVKPTGARDERREEWGVGWGDEGERRPEEA